MNRQDISTKVKAIIANVANLDPAEIADNASFVDDLGLDSLSLLEIGVDVDYEFRLGVPEEDLQKLRTVADTVDLVQMNTSSGADGNAAATAADLAVQVA